MVHNFSSLTWNYKCYQEEIFSIPSINCPFEFSKNPIGSDIKVQYENWVQGLIPKLYKHFLREETLELSVMALDVQEKQLFLPMAKLTDWVFIVDDIVIEKGRVNEEYIDNLFDRSNSNRDVWSQAFWSSINELVESNVHSSLIERIIEEAKNWSLCAVKGIHNIDWLALSDINDYCQFRSYESAAHLGLAISMACRSEYTISSDIMNSEKFQCLLLKYGGINALVNDIYSFSSEFQEKTLSNYIKIDCYVNGNTIQNSMKKVVNYVHQGYHEIQVLSDEIEMEFPNNPTLQHCISCLKRMTASTVGFCSIAPRYNHDAHRKALIGNCTNEDTNSIHSSTTTPIIRG